MNELIHVSVAQIILCLHKNTSVPVMHVSPCITCLVINLACQGDMDSLVKVRGGGGGQICLFYLLYQLRIHQTPPQIPDYPMFLTLG